MAWCYPKQSATFFILHCVASFYQFIIIIITLIIIFISFGWRFLTYTIDEHSWVIRTTSTPSPPHTVHFWGEEIETILSTLHTYINNFVFKVVTIEACTLCSALSHYWMHLWNSTFAIPYSIACHSTSVPAIFKSRNKTSQGARSCKGVVGNDWTVSQP